jgi:hypothetical protein
MHAQVFFSITLAVSVVGLLSILLLKRYELSTGKMVLGKARPKVSRVSHDVVLTVEYILPSLVVRIIKRSIELVKDWLKQVVARAIFLFERMLEVLLHTVREKTRPPRGAGEASAFLREVADHKRELLKRSRDERFIADE